MRIKLTLMMSFITLMILSCGILEEQPINQNNQVDQNVIDGGDNEVVVSNLNISLIIPDYHAKNYEANTRFIDSNTNYVALLIDGVEHQELAIAEGVTSELDSLNDLWTGTFTAIPLGNYAVGSLKVELRDVNHAVLTSGYNTEVQQVEPTGSNDPLSFYTVPETSTPIVKGNAAIQETVTLGDFVYYSFTLNETGVFDFLVTETTGDVDVYVINESGLVIYEDLLSTGNININFTATSSGTGYIAVYGIESSDFGISYTNDYVISEPTNVSATDGSSTSSITITWDNVAGALGYNVYKSSSIDGTYTKLNSDLITDLSYSDSSSSNGVLAYYQVESVDEYDTALSAVDSGYENLYTPYVNYVSEGVYTDQIVVNWSSVYNATGYTLFRRADSDPYVELATITDTIYIDTDVVDGILYDYYVVATNSLTTSSEAYDYNAYIDLNTTYVQGHILTSGQTVEYTFDVVNGTTYYVNYDEYAYDFSLRIVIYKEDGVNTYVGSDTSTPAYFTATDDETVTVEVSAAYTGDTGSFSINVIDADDNPVSFSEATGSAEFVIQ